MKQRKIIAIGESVLDTIFVNNRPQRAIVGGRVTNAAASLGDINLPVTMVSECCTDSVGDFIINFLEQHHVNTNSIDRYTDGATAFSAIFEPEHKIVNYGAYPDERFKVVWPRIDENDIIIFGSLYAIGNDQRERLYELVSYAAERKAIIVYLPGFQHGINFRITKVMPAILENLQISDIVIAHDKDMHEVFPGETAHENFHNHIEFYGALYFHIYNNLSITAFEQNDRKTDFDSTCTTTNLLGWQAGFAAGLIAEIIRQDIDKESLHNLDKDTMRRIAETALQWAADCAQSETNCISSALAAQWK